MAQHQYDIFISYRREGGIDSAVALQSTLRQMHYRAFLDVDGLHAGKFDEALLRHIEYAVTKKPMGLSHGLFL